MLAEIKNDSSRFVCVMRDLHRWMDPTVLRSLRSLARSLQSTDKSDARTIVILSPSSEIPPELQGHAVVLDYPLPDRAEIAAILNDVLGQLSDVPIRKR